MVREKNFSEFERSAVISADAIADALARPRPTAQQREVIESPLAPALVVAGAGSGKTETMANRVLWLLANGHVSANQILGLTFTRKAAGELSLRIRERIIDLDRVGMLPSDYDEFDPPTVATYNSFSNRIYRDNALLLGRESDGAVLGEASAWQLARSIVVGSTDERLAMLDRNVEAITGGVLSLAHALAENVVDAVAVRAFAEEFSRVGDLPAGGRGAYEEVVKLAATIGVLPVLLDLSAEFERSKANRGFVEYSDQVALALRIVREAPRVAAELQEQYRVVLLDEYQDTSVVQTWLLAELFAGTPVMAVGDPNQSIYGWRGASAANLEGFDEQFAAGCGQAYALTTSWRNGRDILAVANGIVAPLTGAVARLDAGPNASAYPVTVVVEETLPDEAEAVAMWLRSQLSGWDRANADQPTAAVLFRARKTQGVFIDALRKHGVKFHVLGLGGLTAEPEIADLVSALTVVNDPSAGAELVRLLSGSRWRLGAKDLFVLSRVASWLAKRDYAQQPLADTVKDRLRNSVAGGEGGSLVDALDFVAAARPGHSQLDDFSALGLIRLRDAGATFARLRARVGLDLLDFVTFVEHDLMLDIEIAANESRSAGTANIEAFFDALSGYLVIDDRASLSGFLGWLREAQWRDNLAPRPEEPEPGTVQLLTVHGAKGLEWDIVVVPRMVEGELPSPPREGANGWLTFGSLPWDFRGDAAELPTLAWRSATTRKELIDAQREFSSLVRAAHEREERRLAYVAVTRARHRLLLTGSFWATQTAARGPSVFLRELEAAGIVGELPVESEYVDNPLGESATSFSWPRDPLGGRRTIVERAAELVAGARPGEAGEWEGQLDLLLEERRRRIEATEVVELPSRVPASRFKDFVSNPAKVAAALRRPMPERPYRATRLGTLFHSWVEERSGISGGSEELDASSAEHDRDDVVLTPEGLAELQRTFEHSQFAALSPVAVEVEIHLVLAGEVIICKLDAVYLIDGRYLVVDWKTGRAPKDAADLETKQLQLALYRQAFAEWKGIDPDLIDAAFYFVAEDRVIRPERIYSRDDLIAEWRKVTAGS